MAQTTDGGKQGDDSECCENPNWAVLPERRFKLPDNDHRATYGECMNCGATEK